MNQETLTRRQRVLFWVALFALNVGIGVASFLTVLVWTVLDRSAPDSPGVSVTVPASGDRLGVQW